MFHDYLEAIASKAKGFTYVIASDEHNQCNGVVWMTPTMRCNFERFGSYISIDCMKRELNTMAWPYFAISLKNELNKICVGCEGLIISERKDAYKFLIDSAISMAPKRKHEDILVVSGDGFFDQATITEKLGLKNAKFIADRWHLFEVVF